MNAQPQHEPKNTQQAQKNTDQELVDLPDQAPQQVWKKYLLAPKFLILTFFALFFIGRNIYLEYNRPQTSSVKAEEGVEKKQPQMSPQLYQRFFSYIALTVVFFVIFLLLKRSNDKAQEQRIRQEVKKQEEQAEKQKKIDQKAKKILTSMDQFGNVINSEVPAKTQIKNESEQSKKEK